MSERSQPYVVGSQFVNPWPTWRHKTYFEVLIRIWHLCRPDAPSQTELDKKWPVVRPTFPKKIDENEVRATWLGHATVLFQLDGVRVLCDPMFSDYSSPIQGFGPKRLRQPPCRVDELPDIDAVLISHTHYDHLDYNSVMSVKKHFPNVAWFVPRGCGSWMHSSGIHNVQELTWWQDAKLNRRPGFRLIFTPTQHWSRRAIFDTDKILWGSWVIEGPKSRVWFSGDTGYCPVFKQIGDKHGPFDIAAIPIGAYGPRWFMRHQHINPDEAVQIHQDVKAKTSLAIHWGTFIMTEEPFLEPPELLQESLEKANIPKNDFFVVTHGQSVTVRTDCDSKLVE